MKILFFIFFVSSALAESLFPKSTKYDFQAFPEYQGITNHIKTFGEFSPAPVKRMSRGEQAVEDAKAKNRAILAARNEKKNKEELSYLEKLKLEDQKTRDGWKKEVRDQLDQWKKEQDIFLGRIKVYKENTFEIPIPKEKIIEVKIPENRIPDAHIVNAAFDIPIQDQWNRPTCSAFAGVRAVEIILKQNQRPYKLSEQYFYWASKPKCTKSPCSEKGSWVTPALRFSSTQSKVDIPLESDCGYEKDSIPQNETQLPLKPGCFQGKARVKSFKELKSLSEVVEHLKNDQAVIMAAKLSENFYQNKGLVTLADSEIKTTKKLDSHSLGHAFLAMGIIELPESLKKKEGNFCLLIANSWGKGWGVGGYSCLTENWLLKFRQPSPFVVVSELTL